MNIYGGRYEARHGTFSGGAGIVEVCADTNLDRLVAIKFLHGNTERRRIQDEVAALQRIRSKNVVDVYDIVIAQPNNRVGIVQEYLPGQDLAEFTETPIDNDSFFRSLFQLSNGLTDIHDQGLIHRDIKLNNLKFNAEMILKIFDFNLSRDRNNATTIGFRGTVGYAAPELYNSAVVSLTHHIDIYALAISALLLRSSSLPPELSSIPPEPDKWVANGGFASQGLPAELTQLLNAALAADPRRRPEARDIRSCLAGILLRGRHRALIMANGQTHRMDTTRPVVRLAHPSVASCWIELSYSGTQFLVKRTGSDVWLNNQAIVGGSSIPGACVIALGGPQLPPQQRVFITVDLSHPEVVL